MRTVLIADDEPTFRETLCDGLAEFAAEFRTIKAADGVQAAAMLDRESVDVLVTDVRMPRLDGIGLLAHVSRHHPSLVVIVMTAYGSPELRRAVEDHGVLACLEKPVDFGELLGRIRQALQVHSEGRIRGIRLPAFLQLVELERKTCTLRVVLGDRTGALFFRDGVLIDAETERDGGTAAAYDLVTWEDAEIEIEGACRRTERRIEMVLGGILMDAFRLKDEMEHTGRLSVELAGYADAGAIGGSAAPGSGWSPVSGPASADPWPSEGGVEMSKMQEILGKLTAMEGVAAACFVGRDGFLLGSSVRHGVDAEMVAAIAASGFGSSESMGRQLAKGAVSLAMIEFDSGPVLLCPVGSVGLVVVVAEQTAGLGLLRVQLRRHAGELLAQVA